MKTKTKLGLIAFGLFVLVAICGIGIYVLLTPQQPLSILNQKLDLKNGGTTAIPCTHKVSSNVGDDFTLQPGQTVSFDAYNVVEGRCYCDGSNYYINGNLVAAYRVNDPSTYVIWKSAACLDQAYVYTKCATYSATISNIQCGGSSQTTTTLSNTCVSGQSRTTSCTCTDSLTLECEQETCQCNYYNGQYTNCHYTGGDEMTTQCQYSNKICKNGACVTGSTYCPTGTSKTTQTCEGTGLRITTQTCNSAGSAWTTTNSQYESCPSGKHCVSPGLCAYNADSCENHGYYSSGSITYCTRHDVEGVGWCYSNCRTPTTIKTTTTYPGQTTTTLSISCDGTCMGCCAAYGGTSAQCQADCNGIVIQDDRNWFEKLWDWFIGLFAGLGRWIRGG